MEKKINIGCGQDKLEDFIGIDISPDVNPDIVLDIDNNPLPFEDNEVYEINAGCVIEQLDNLVFVMNECFRVLKPGGLMKGYVPSIDPRVLHLDPMDKHFFQEDSFKYFDKKENAWQQFGFNYGLSGWSYHHTWTNDNGIIHFTLTK